MRMIIIRLSVVCPAILTILIILIASSDTTTSSTSKHITFAEAIVNTNPLRRLRQLISLTSSRNRSNSSSNNTIDTSSKTTSVTRFTVQDHPHPEPSQEAELKSSQLKRCSSSNHHRQHRSFHRVKKRIQRIMGQSISTSQWYVYGRRHFTKTGYQRHIKDYNENVQNCILHSVHEFPLLDYEHYETMLYFLLLCCQEERSQWNTMA